MSLSYVAFLRIQKSRGLKRLEKDLLAEPSSPSLSHISLVCQTSSAVQIRCWLVCSRSAQLNYQRGHSTETALAMVLSDILMALDQVNVAALALLLLSAAFDTLDHRILLRRLRESVWCAPTRRRHHVPTSDVLVCNEPVHPVQSVRDLGVYVDGAMTMRTHIHVLSCFSTLGQINHTLAR